MSSEKFISTWSRGDNSGYKEYLADLKQMRLNTSEALDELDGLIEHFESSLDYTESEKEVLIEKCKTQKILFIKRQEVVEQRIHDVAEAVYEELEFKYGAGAIAAAGLSDPSTKIFGYYNGLCTKLENILNRMYFGG